MSAHVDVARALTPHRLREGLNALVRPHPVSVLAVEPVADDWHARFSCIGRRYLYRILNRRAPPALDAGRVWHIAVPLDAEAMRDGAAHLVGRHDFTTFRSAQCQSDSPVKTLDRLDVGRAGEEIHIDGCGAQLPPSPGALDGRVPGAGRARPVAAGRYAARRWRRGTVRRLASTRRRTGSISSRRFTPRRASRGRAGGFPSLRAGAEAVGAGAEDGDQVAVLGARQLDLVAEQVERRAQAAGDGDVLPRAEHRSGWRRAIG